MLSVQARFRTFQATAFGILFLLIAIALLTIVFPLTIVFVCIIIGCTAVFMWRPQYAVYGMALTYPFLNLEIIVGNINVPIVDIFGLAALAAVALRLCLDQIFMRRSFAHIRTPGLWFWVAFIIVALSGTPHAFAIDESLKYVARPLAFFYIIFVVSVPAIVNTRRILRTTVICMLIVAVLIGMYGLCGLLLVDTPTLLQRRVVPFSLFGYFPLGYNQNLIADVMVTTVPIAWYMFVTARDGFTQRIYFLLMLFLGVVGLLTFSRSAWLALAVEVVALILLAYRSRIRRLLPAFVVFSIAVLPLVIYMFVFLQQDLVSSSNENRLLLAETAIQMFQEHPWVGAGPGTFITAVERNPVYMQEFGTPLDAHSVIYKVLAENGALGCIAFFGLVIAIGLTLYRSLSQHGLSSDERLFLVCLCTMSGGIFFFQFFQTSYFVSKLWFPIGVSLSASYILNTTQKKNS